MTFARTEEGTEAARIEDAIQQVKDGRVQAYEIVVQAHQRRLRALIAHLCPPGVDPDEIAQRAFVEAFKKIDAYAPHTNFFAWLASIGRAMVLVELRRIRGETRKHHNYLQHLVTEAIETDLDASPMPDERRLLLLRDCLSGLPDDRRALLEMRYTAETPLAAIAGRIGSTASAVKFQLFDLRRKLRDCVRRKLMAEGN